MKPKISTPSPSVKSGASPQAKPSEPLHAKTVKRVGGRRKAIKMGDVFTRLTVLSRAVGPPYSYWHCACSCGGTIKSKGSDLLRQSARSCGCLIREEARQKSLRHGHAVDGNVASEYTIWSGLKTRCFNTKEKDWERYGGRGITVCDRWKNSFEAFLEDMGPRPSKDHSIDRENNDGNYEPGNCRWATRQDQQGNRSNSRQITWMGETHCAAWWERKFGLKRGNLSGRLRIGWSIERALIP